MTYKHIKFRLMITGIQIKTILNPQVSYKRFKQVVNDNIYDVSNNVYNVANKIQLINKK